MVAPPFPDVRPGQVWGNRAHRDAGRQIRIDSVGHEHAICTVIADRTDPAPSHRRPHTGIARPPGYSNVGRKTRVALGAFRPTPSRYALVTDA